MKKKVKETKLVSLLFIFCYILKVVRNLWIETLAVEVYTIIDINNR